MSNKIDQNDILNLKKLIKDKEFIEVRILNVKYKGTVSGYYDDIDKLYNDISQYNGLYNIYYTLNTVNKEISARSYNKLTEKCKITTKDEEIVSRDYFIIDVDPERPIGISSTKEEKNESNILLKRIKEYLKNCGFEEPISADSGNGGHLLYKINCENTLENTEIIKNMLNYLAELYDTNTAKIDKSVFNVSRITKLYGTTACKGDNLENRPHRKSKIFYIPEEIKNTDISKLKVISDQYVAIQELKNAQKINSNINNNFDLDGFINKNLELVSSNHDEKGYRYIVNCPFHNDHEAAIFKVSNTGNIIFNCFHNRCQGKTWKDVRVMFEPGCYDKKENKKVDAPKINNFNLELDNLDDYILDVGKINPYDHSKSKVLRTGVPTLDYYLGGFESGKITLWTGLSGSGKSTFISNCLLEILNQDEKVFVFSGELMPDRFQYWTNLQAAGEDNLKLNVNTKTGREYYTIKKDVLPKILNWYNERFYLYNNKKSVDYTQILKIMEMSHKKKGINNFIIDNVMTLDLSKVNRDKWEAQSEFILSITRFAQDYNVHVHVVAHPKKTFNPIITKWDISGTGNLLNRVDNCLCVHKCSNSFITEFTKVHEKNSSLIEQVINADNIVEIFKSRETGDAEIYIPLKFNKPSKRLYDQRFENLSKRVYKWDLNNNTEVPVYNSNNTNYVKKETQVTITDQEVEKLPWDV